jgi:hypothetical protein
VRFLQGEIMRIRDVVFVLALALGSASLAYAQDAGQVGLTIAYPAAIGVIVHVTDAVAVRPDVTFSQSTSDNTGMTNTAVSAGISGLFYVGRWDNLRAYVSPRFGYQRSSTSGTNVVGGVLGIAPVTNVYSGTGSFGAQYLLHKRLAVFGETGLAYTHTASNLNVTAAPPAADTTAHSWATKAGIGMIFYF